MTLPSADDPGDAAVGSPPADSSAASISIPDLQAELKTAQDARAAAETRVDVLEAELSRFKDQHAFVAAAKAALETQLRDEREAREKADEKVELLRGQVEASRRMFMSLQKQEQNRAATAAAAATVAPAPLADEEPVAPLEDKKAKRQSLYGRITQRPVSGVSATSDTPEIPGGAASGLRELRLGSSGHVRGASRHLKVDPSKLFENAPRSPSTAKMPKSPRSPMSPSRPLHRMAEGGGEDKDKPKSSNESSPTGSPRTAVTPAALITTPPATAKAVPSPPVAPSALPTSNPDDLQAAKEESEHLRAQLLSMAARLADSEEARTASEDCLRALREFMSGDMGSMAVNLPPLPTEDEVPELPSTLAPKSIPPRKLSTSSSITSTTESKSDTPPAESKGWGSFRLWGAAAPVDDPTISTDLASPKIAVSPPLDPDGASSSIVSSEAPREKEPVSSADVALANQPTALGRSLTQLFGGRARRKPRKAPEPAMAIEEDEPVPELEVDVVPTSSMFSSPTTVTHPQLPVAERAPSVDSAALEALTLHLPPPPSEVTSPTSLSETEARDLASAKQLASSSSAREGAEQLFVAEGITPAANDARKFSLGSKPERPARKFSDTKADTKPASIMDRPKYAGAPPRRGYTLTDEPVKSPVELPRRGFTLTDEPKVASPTTPTISEPVEEPHTLTVLPPRTLSRKPVPSPVSTPAQPRPSVELERTSLDSSRAPLSARISPSARSATSPLLASSPRLSPLSGTSPRFSASPVVASPVSRTEDALEELDDEKPDEDPYGGLDDSEPSTPSLTSSPVGDTILSYMTSDDEAVSTPDEAPKADMKASGVAGKIAAIAELANESPKTPARNPARRAGASKRGRGGARGGYV